jgi:hypothetical protein
VIPPNVVLHRLPPCTPELQPIETVWPLVREAVADRPFRGLGHLKRVVRRRCTTWPITPTPSAAASASAGSAPFDFDRPGQVGKMGTVFALCNSCLSYLAHVR